MSQGFGQDDAPVSVRFSRLSAERKWQHGWASDQGDLQTGASSQAQLQEQGDNNVPESRSATYKAATSSFNFLRYSMLQSPRSSLSACKMSCREGQCTCQAAARAPHSCRGTTLDRSALLAKSPLPISQKSYRSKLALMRCVLMAARPTDLMANSMSAA